MKNRITKYVIILLGLFFGSIFMISNFTFLKKYANQLLLVREYGDLYYGNYLDKFKVEIPREKPFGSSKLNSPLKKAGLILYGDSFSNYRYFKGVPEVLEDSLEMGVHFAHHRFDGPPLSYLSKNEFQKSEQAKYFVYQTIERALPKRLKAKSPLPKISKKKSSLKNKIKSWLPKNVSSVYSVLLQDGKFTRRPYSFLMNKRYEWFGYIASPEVIDEKSGMLFSDRTTTKTGATTSFYTQFSDEDIETYCKHLELLSKEIESTYGLKFVFFPIPNKYTVYHQLLNKDEYNGLLPRLNECLAQKGINYVDVYSAFMNSQELIYYNTDTHWNEKGAHLAIDLLMEKIRAID